MCNNCRQQGLFLLPELEELLGEDNTTTSSPQPKNLALTNTDLDAPYFGGNFDFAYQGGSEATVTFNTFLLWRNQYSRKEKNDLIKNLQSAVDTWDKAAQVQIRDSRGSYSKNITLRFRLAIVQDAKNADKTTDVHPTNTWSSWFNGKNREIVMRDLNVFIGTERNVFVHELGHVWGLLDEYDAGWLENHLSPGHIASDSPLIKDVHSIMNMGYGDPKDSGEFRVRYFSHFARSLAGAFWGVPDLINPVRHNGKIVSKTIQGRILLLKKNIAGDPPFATDMGPFNPQYGLFQIAKR